MAALVGLLLASLAAQAATTWDSIGPPGGSVSVLMADPTSASTLYAGTPENGVFVSTDGGQTWSASNSGLSTSTSGRQTLYTVRAIANDGRYAYAATDAGLFYRSLLAGSPWEALTATGSATPIAFIAFDSGTKRLFAASDMTDGLSAPVVFSTALDTTAGLPAPAWSAHALPLGAGTMAIGSLGVVTQPTPTSSAGLVVAVGGGLWSAPILAADQTLTWINADPSGTLAGSTVSAITYSPDFDQTYACSGGSGYYTHNVLEAQPVWTLLNVPASTGVSLNCTAFLGIGLAVGGTPQLALGSDQGAFASLDGVNFLATGSLGSSTFASSLAIATQPGAGAASVFVGSGFGVSSVSVPLFVGGANWAASNGPASVSAGGSNHRLNNTAVVDSAVIGTTLYAAADSNFYAEVFASSDSGATWTATSIGAALNPFEGVRQLAADASRGNLYAGTTQGLLVRSSSSSTWAAVTAFNFGEVTALAMGTSNVFAGTFNGIKAVPLATSPAMALPVDAGLAGQNVTAVLVNGGTVYAAVVNGVGDSLVYTASESSAAAGTATWTAFGSGIVGSDRVNGLVLVSGQLLAATGGGLVKMATAGTAWVSANTSATSSQHISDAFGVANAIYTDGTSVYVGTASNGMFVSPVGTSFTWAELNGTGDSALPTIEVLSLRANGSTLYAATRAGMAAYAGLTPVVTPPVTPSSSGGGGGAIDLRFAVLLLAAIWALRRTRARR